MSQPNMKLANELQRIIVADLDSHIAKLKREGRTELAEKLERFKRVFFIEPNDNFELLTEGVYRYKKEK